MFLLCASDKLDFFQSMKQHLITSCSQTCHLIPHGDFPWNSIKGYQRRQSNWL